MSRQNEEGTAPKTDKLHKALAHGGMQPYKVKPLSSNWQLWENVVLKKKQVKDDGRKKEGEISYTGLEASIGSIQEICLAKPVEEPTITPMRKLTNLNSEETGEGQVQGLYTTELVENLKTQCLCLYPNTVMIQKHG